MKTFKQAHEVLKDARKFHLDIQRVYENLLDASSDRRTILLLTHMIDHEKRMAKNLEHYGTVAGQKVMQTWLQYTPEESCEEFMRDIELSDPPTIREIATLSREVDRYFHDLYEAVHGTMESIEAKEVFEDLKQIQDKERITLSMATNSLFDM